MTKCIKRIRDHFEYALYKFTLYLLTYLPVYIATPWIWELPEIVFLKLRSIDLAYRLWKTAPRACILETKL